MKTHSGAKKRIKVLGNGKSVKHKSPGRRHLLKNKSHKRKRQLARTQVMADGNANMLRVRAMLNI